MAARKKSSQTSAPAGPRRTTRPWYALAIGAAAVAAWCVWPRAAAPKGVVLPTPPLASVPVLAPLLTIEALKAEELRIAEELNRDFPNNVRAIGILGNVYSSHGFQSRAVACWEKALAINPNDPSGYDAMAMVAFQKEDLARAIELWQKAATLDANLNGVYHRLGQALMLAGKTQAAINAFTRNFAISPRAFESHYFLGQILSQMQRYAEAKAHYARAIEIEPRCVKAYYGLAMVHTRLGEKAESQEAMRRFSEYKSKDVAADIDLRGTHDDVESFARRMASVLTNCGEAYIAANNGRKAEELWRRAAALDRTATICRAQLARILQQTRHEKEALALGLELCALEPTNGLHVLNVGILQLRGRDLAAAEQSFKKVCEVAPDNSDGFRLLAQLYLERADRAADALRCAEKAVAIEPIAPNYFVLGAVYVKNGDREQARAVLERAVALEPHNLEYRQTYEKLIPQK